MKPPKHEHDTFTQLCAVRHYNADGTDAAQCGYCTTCEVWIHWDSKEYGSWLNGPWFNTSAKALEYKNEYIVRM